MDANFKKKRSKKYFPSFSSSWDLAESWRRSTRYVPCRSVSEQLWCWEQPTFASASSGTLAALSEGGRGAFDVPAYIRWLGLLDLYNRWEEMRTIDCQAPPNSERVIGWLSSKISATYEENHSKFRRMLKCPSSSWRKKAATPAWIGTNDSCPRRPGKEEMSIERMYCIRIGFISPFSRRDQLDCVALVFLY